MKVKRISMLAAVLAIGAIALIGIANAVEPSQPAPATEAAAVDSPTDVEAQEDANAQPAAEQAVEELEAAEVEEIEMESVDAASSNVTVADSFLISCLDAPDGNPINALCVDNSGNMILVSDRDIRGVDTIQGSSDLRFSGNPSAIDMTITSTGLVGIGTGSPTANLHVKGSSQWDLSGGGKVTVAEPFGKPGIVGVSENNHRRDIRFLDTGMALVTRSINDAPVATNGIFIGENGRVGIGTDSPSQRLHVSGTVQASDLTTTSDRRYKKDIETVQNARELVAHLRGVRFNWDANAHPEQNFDGSRQIGFIAQEVQAVVPEAVRVGSDGYMSVDYSRLSAVLVEAVKDQQTQIGELTTQNAQLKGRLDAIEKAIGSKLGSIVTASSVLPALLVVGLLAARNKRRAE